MNVDTISSQGGFGQQQVKPAESLETDRKAKDSMASAEPQATDSSKVQPEEILDPKSAAPACQGHTAADAECKFHLKTYSVLKLLFGGLKLLV